jgi:hypothetical protein
LDPAADLEALAAKAGLEDDLLDPLELAFQPWPTPRDSEEATAP